MHLIHAGILYVGHILTDYTLRLKQHCCVRAPSNLTFPGCLYIHTHPQASGSGYFERRNQSCGFIAGSHKVV